MREIKFRGIVLDEFRWTYGSFVIEPGFYKRNGLEDLNRPVTRYYICDQDGVYQDVCPTTVGQFTGLKDKNGKEIYEGDLIKLATGAGLFEIVFENGCWSYISGPGSYAWGLYEHVRPGCDYLNLEVVYRVYENPELLK